MKIICHKILDEYHPAKVQFFRVDPEDISTTLNIILSTLTDLSWITKFDQDYEKSAFNSRAKKTIDDIKKKFQLCIDDNITREAGEYVVSELARETIVNQLKYLDIPLAELIGKKRSGNPGFDFHSQNSITETIIFGEAKYNSQTTSHSMALKQIVKFINDNKDIEDLLDIKHFCTSLALDRANNGQKGFAAAFSSKNAETNKIIEQITKNTHFNSLLNYEEMILVAIDL